MKVQIVLTDEDKIEGFTAIELKDLGVAMEDISDNKCEFIVATKVMNILRPEQIEDFIGLLTSKLRRGGSLVVSGIETKVLCKMIVNDIVREETLNNIVSQCNSAIPMKSCLDLLSKKGLKINNASINGVEYEISAKRD
tara:strand:+ start:9649 stop:10065 length:417 start_codon:yes stop_codon:yes gene_type:complete